MIRREEGESILRTITIYEGDYDKLNLIAKKNDLTGDGGKISMRETIRYLIQNFGDKIA